MSHFASVCTLENFIRDSVITVFHQTRTLFSLRQAIANTNELENAVDLEGWTPRVHSMLMMTKIEPRHTK
jgi:hypothetical protein